jgi:cytochrome c
MKYQVATTIQIRKTRLAMAAIALCFSLPIAVTLAMPLPSQAAGASVGDPERGRLAFERRCTGCHSLDQDKEGPRLRTVFGRKAGTINTFKYSDALKSAQVTWNETALDKWLTDTETLVPDNDMEFHVPSAEERADIIQFLRVSSGK